MLTLRDRPILDWDDPLSRLVTADWEEEYGDPVRGQAIRLVVRRGWEPNPDYSAQGECASWDWWDRSSMRVNNNDHRKANLPGNLYKNSTLHTWGRLQMFGSFVEFSSRAAALDALLAAVVKCIRDGVEI